MGAVPDLNRPIFYRGIELNSPTTIDPTRVNGKPVIVGCQVDWFDPTEVEIRQFREPLALQDGIDVGGTWIGARRLSLRGTVYDKSRGETFDRLSALEEVMTAQSGSFGYYPLTYYTISGVDGTLTLKSIDCLPNGLRYAIVRDEHGGDIDEPLAIRWSALLYAKRPAVVNG